MKIIDYTIELSDDLLQTDYISHTYPDSKTIYFDIETTGLKAANSTLYLIGALWYDNNAVQIRQWFNEDGYSEKEIIESFNAFCMDFDILVHFNGLTFDVPYIREKAKKHSLSVTNIDRLQQIDIYKEIRSYKNLLGLENAKQVTIEKYVGLSRDDIYSGGELINVYQRYVVRPDYEKEHLLLLHNHDDLLGMPNISQVLYYKALFETPRITVDDIYQNNDEQKLIINFSLDDRLIIPKRLMFTDKNGIFINIFDKKGIIIIPIITANLKHYFKDYKNYYYLPKEDVAIHKSVASYVEPENRKKATKENCYISKEASFIICFDQNYSESFKKELKDKAIYRTCDSLIAADIEEQNEYAKTLIKSMH